MSLLILGGDGYCGSALWDALKPGYSMRRADLLWYGHRSDDGGVRVVSEDYACFDAAGIQTFDAVLLFAGHSSVGMCRGMPLSAFRNNVVNFVDLANKMRPEQLLIYASSASVYGKNLGRNEEMPLPEPIEVYDYTKAMIDGYAHFAAPRCVGLRMGTVCGGAPHLRVDTVLNAFYHSYRTTGKIRVANPMVCRPILAISDLVRAVDRILETPGVRGVFNVASFNGTIGALAEAFVSRYPDCGTERQEMASSYNMTIDTRKFRERFDFQFTGQISTILDSLEKEYEDALKTVRTEPREYRGLPEPG